MSRKYWEGQQWWAITILEMLVYSPQSLSLFQALLNYMRNFVDRITQMNEPKEGPLHLIEIEARILINCDNSVQFLSSGLYDTTYSTLFLTCKNKC